MACYVIHAHLSRYFLSYFEEERRMREIQLAYQCIPDEKYDVPDNYGRVSKKEA
jgi:hypothetical protein